MRFADVIGQEKVKRHLLRMVQSGQLPHALMFCGPQGVGKLPLALAFARYLLCEHPSADEACHQCNGCRMTDNWTHPDLHFSFPRTDPETSSGWLSTFRKQPEKSSPHCCADRILHLVRTTFYACHPNIPHDRGNGLGVMVCKKALYKEKLK